MSPASPASPTGEGASAEVARLLDYLKSTRGFDFSAYKLTGLLRRIQKRMRALEVESYNDYLDYLEVHPQEFWPLFDTVLINVTSFFRDPAAWSYLASQILPRILEEKPAPKPLRLWSAGCASGEEAYTLVMLMAEALGEEALRQRVKIYATDADERALNMARQASYDAKQVTGVPEPLLAKYFEPAGNRFVFRPDLRRCVIFGRLDLVQDAAISRLDLLVCRNTMMYFNGEAQQRILARFHFALNRNGYLFLGRAETLLTHGELFRPADLRHRIFARAPGNDVRERLLALLPAGAPAPEGEGSQRQNRLLEAAFEASAVAQIAVDRRGLLAHANEQARLLLGLKSADLGRLLQDLEVSYRPVELRSLIEAVHRTREPAELDDVEWRSPPGGEVRRIKVRVEPLTDSTGAGAGAMISYLDLTESRQLSAELERANQRLETAYEELQAANEELETTNEELHSTVEELETTNEELQSANEEQETMNEELQSTNEELRTMNERLQAHSVELDSLNAYLQSILGGLRAAVIAVDRNLQVQLWSDRAKELWGLREEEAKGKPLLDLDIGLPVAQLEPLLRHVLAQGRNGRGIEVDGINRRGRPIRCFVQVSVLRSERGVEGMIMLVDELSAAGS
jgi:two-component system CheB/CheR fusion protein